MTFKIPNFTYPDFQNVKYKNIKDISLKKVDLDGMIKMALEKYPEIDLENSFIAGDSLCDVQLGERLGIKTFGIRLDRSKGKTIKIDSLKDIVKYL